MAGDGEESGGVDSDGDIEIFMQETVEAEAGRSDADDGERGLGEEDGASQDRGIGGEAAAPERIGENHDPLTVFAPIEDSSAAGGDAENVEVVGGDREAEAHFGRLGGADANCKQNLGLREDAGDGSRAGEVAIVKIRNEPKRVQGRSRVNADDFAGAGDGQRAKQDGVGDAGQRDGESDPDGEGKDGEKTGGIHAPR